MKKFLGLLGLLIILLVIGNLSKLNLNIPSWQKILYYSPCDTPIHYKIGDVDPRFNLSKTQFLVDINEAATLWDNTEGKQLFVYDPQKGTLVISLIYDQRQLLDSQITNLQSQLNNEKQSLSPETSQYQQESADFKNKVAAFNTQVAQLNVNGGANPQQYQQIQQEQQSLQAEAQKLDQEAQSLNESANQYNSQIGQLNQTINSFNSDIQTQPEEGVYDPAFNTITIYFDVNQNEFIHTLTHEMGHSLGMQHIQNKNAIMYPYTTQVTTVSPQDKAQLDQICEEKSILEILKSRVEYIYNYYETKFNL